MSIANQQRASDFKAALGWGLGCGVFGFLHRYRATRVVLQASSRGVFCFGAAYVVSGFASSRDSTVNQTRRAQEALRSLKNRSKAAAAKTSSSEAIVEFDDTDGDRITFMVDPSTQMLSYLVNGVLKVSDITTLQADGRSIRIAGTPAGAWDGSRRTMVQISKSVSLDAPAQLDLSSAEEEEGRISIAPSSATDKAHAVEILFRESRIT